MTDNSRLVVYTAIFGQYDDLKEPPDIPGCDFICFTDSPNLTSTRYEVRCVTPALDAFRESRRYKIQPHVFFPQYEYSLWIDASFCLTKICLVEAVAGVLQENDLALCVHPNNDGVYAELERCIYYQKDAPEVMTRQCELYRSQGLPENTGLFAGGMIARRHNSAVMQRFARLWWHEVTTYSKRDQLSLGYLIWKENIAVTAIDAMRWKAPDFTTGWGTFVPHKRRS